MANLNPSRSREVQFYTTGAVNSANPVAEKIIITQSGNNVCITLPSFVDTATSANLLTIVMGDGSTEDDQLFTRMLSDEIQQVPTIVVDDSATVLGIVIIPNNKPTFGYLQFFLGVGISAAAFTNGTVVGMQPTSFTYNARRVQGLDYN